MGEASDGSRACTGRFGVGSSLLPNMGTDESIAFCLQTNRPKGEGPVHTLYYGDNLQVLREYIKDESVDLVYLDPPFNSDANYNVLFRGASGEKSHAQIEVFEDTWHWTDEAEGAFDEVMRSGNGDVAEMLRALRSFLKENDMMAYLTMMAVRLLELHRVLKSTGSLYLHCDPTASHYLKILLDNVFGPEMFVSEIIWRRTNARGTTGKWPSIHDVILQYSKSSTSVFKALKVKADSAKMPHTLITGADGLKYQTYELTAPGATKEGASGKPWRGFDPNKYGRHWANSPAQMNEWDESGLIHWPRDGGFPRRLADEPFDPASRQITVGDVWTDIDRLNQTAKERLGYPTQKPLALLERIIVASSNEGDIVLDPFCGCGTTIHAAQKLNRQWIGIDVTHLAISLIEKRLKDAFPGITFTVHGTPKDLDGAIALALQDKYQFQWWAVSLVDAVPYGGKKKGADSGIDGFIYFKPDGKTTEKAIVSVKGGNNVNVSMVRDLGHVIKREKAPIGIFITLSEPTSNMRTEAVKEGFYETPYGKFPRLQILTVAELLGGKQPHLPWIDTSSFKKAAKEDLSKQDSLF
jgi:DNA modification methylase